MRCEECLPLVEEYADGELDGRTSDLMAGHLDACSTCAIAYRKVLREEELYLRYECDAEAAPAFWENVMARASTGENRTAHTQTPSRPRSSLRGWLRGAFGNFSTPRFSPSLTALMVLVAVGLTAVVMSYLNPKEKPLLQTNVSQDAGAPSASVRPDAPATSGASTAGDNEATSRPGSEPNVNRKAQVAAGGGGGKLRYTPVAKKEAARFSRKPSTAEGELTPDTLIREAEQKYVAAISLLSRDLSRRRSQLDAETAAQFERTLVAVDRTIADTRRAARKHPNDPVAAKYVLTAYAKKVDLLREMIGY